MIVHYKINIGYPTAQRTGSVDVPDEELEGKTKEQREEIIDQSIWEDAMQYVEVYPVGLDEIDEIDE